MCWCSALYASKVPGCNPAQRGITSDSCPPQLTAIIMCCSDSQNRTIFSSVPFFSENVKSPQALVICCFASSYCGKEESNGKSSESTLGCFFRYSNTACVVRPMRSSLAGKVRRPRMSSQALKGCMPLPMAR